VFFFEKKNQKTLIYGLINKGFLLLFSKKEVLSFLFSGALAGSAAAERMKCRALSEVADADLLHIRPTC
jgi:hypothetical protein